MSWISKTYKKAKNSVSGAASSVYGKIKPSGWTGSNVVAVVAPYASLYTTAGRRGIADTWGKVASPVAPYLGAVGPAGAIAGNLITTGTNIFRTPDPGPRNEGGGSGDAGGVFQTANADGSRSTAPWLYAVAAALVGLLALLLYRRLHK